MPRARARGLDAHARARPRHLHHHRRARRREAAAARRRLRPLPREPGASCCRSSRSGGVFYGGLIARGRRSRSGICARHRLPLWTTCDVVRARASRSATSSAGWAASWPAAATARPTDVPWAITFHESSRRGERRHAAGRAAASDAALRGGRRAGHPRRAALLTERRGRPFPGRTFWATCCSTRSRASSSSSTAAIRAGWCRHVSTSQFISLHPRAAEHRACSSGSPPRPGPPSPDGAAQAGRRATASPRAATARRRLGPSIRGRRRRRTRRPSARSLSRRVAAGSLAIADPAADQRRPCRRDAGRSDQRQARRSAPARACPVEMPGARARDAAAEDAAARRSSTRTPTSSSSNKPAGMVVHPAAGHAAGTLVNALLHHVNDLSGIGGELRPGIVHRLDRGTSGVMVVAKHDARARGAGAAVPRSRGREGIHRARLGRRAGRPPDRRADRPRSGRPAEDVDAGAARAIGRDAHHAARALSRRVAVQVAIATGRTHQIRVHLSAIGHPIVGDPTYGGVHRRVPGDLRAVQRLERPFLHAARLAFTHPADGSARGVRLRRCPTTCRSVIDDDPRGGESDPMTCLYADVTLGTNGSSGHVFTSTATRCAAERPRSHAWRSSGTRRRSCCSRAGARIA